MYIQIKSGGRTTDQIIRYAVALYIQKKYPDSCIVNYKNAEWKIETPQADVASDTVLSVGRSEFDNIDEILEKRPESILVTWPVLDVEIFKSVRSELVELLSKLQSDNTGERTLANGEILIHMRLGDITRFVHRDYWPLPIKFYQKLCARENLRPVFIGELFKHPEYFEQIQNIIPNARMIPHGTVMEDFLRINTAHRIVLSLSSYAWLAAWLSDTAEEIHLPYCGIFSELRRPDIKLRDVNDTRYHYHVLPNLNWKQTVNVMKQNLELDSWCCGLSDKVTLWETNQRKLSAQDRIQLIFERAKRHISR